MAPSLASDRLEDCLSSQSIFAVSPLTRANWDNVLMGSIASCKVVTWILVHTGQATDKHSTSKYVVVFTAICMHSAGTLVIVAMRLTQSDGD